MKLRIILLLILACGCVSPALAKEYTFGVVPQQSSKKLAKLWGPLLAKLSADSGIELKFATAKDIPTFEKRLAAGEYDFAYMNPYHFTVFNRTPGYVALARQRDKEINGIIVVRKDSLLRKIEDLENETLAFPSPAAFAATILSQSHLNKSGVKFNSRYVSSHDSVYLAVARGLLPAGGGIVRTLNNTDPKVRERLRIFWKSDGYTPHAFTSHPRVEKHIQQNIARALSSLEASEEGLNLLSTLNFKGIQFAEDKEWDDVRELQITALDE